MSFRVGVDIGGTFTDFCAFNDVTNEIHTLKVLSSPDKPGSEVIDGIRRWVFVTVYQLLMSCTSLMALRLE